MKEIPKTYYESSILVCYILLIPVYSFFFLIGFKPFHIDLLLDVDISQLAFRAAIMASIELVVALISRMAMLLTRDSLRLTHTQYIAWEVMEGIAITMFITLFLWLIGKKAEPYFSLLPSMFLVTASILLFPYIITSLIAELHDRNNRIEAKDEIISQYAKGLIGNEAGPVHFRDSQNMLKLVVAAEMILYIEAANNYVNICYLKGDKLVQYQLRNKMKEIEDICEQHNLFRCHRSYFINLSRVRLIQKEADGMFAELDYTGARHIPVSKTYSEEIINKMANINGHLPQ